MERIENPMVMFRECEEEPKALEICSYCKDKMYHGNRYWKIGDKYFCSDCVEQGELDCNDYE